MAVRSIVFGAAFLAAASLVSGCSKTEEHAENTAPAVPPVQAAVEPAAPAGAVPESGGILLPADAAAGDQPAPLQTEREVQLELKAAAAEARARLAEIELREQTARALAQQQQAAQIEAARAEALAVENAALRADAENAALRSRMLEREQRALEAERAAYGVRSVIVVQPPQRYGYGGPSNNPPIGNGSQNIGLNRPAVPDLTPPGPPATFSPPKNTQPSFGEPQFDTMRARKPGPREAQSP